MNPGRLIVLEGVEGTGKSTQIRDLARWLDELALAHIVTREPGGTAVGEAIRRLVLNRGDLSMPPETELFLILGSRAAFCREVVLPALEAGQIVLADRFDFSTFAYQGYGRGLELSLIREANAMATTGLEPDLYLVLDLPVEEGLERKGRGEERDRIEQEGIPFLTRVADGYKILAHESSKARLVSATGSPSQVQARIRRILLDVFPETFSRPGV